MQKIVTSLNCAQAKISFNLLWEWSGWYTSQDSCWSRWQSGALLLTYSVFINATITTTIAVNNSSSFWIFDDFFFICAAGSDVSKPQTFSETLSRFSSSKTGQPQQEACCSFRILDPYLHPDGVDASSTDAQNGTGDGHLCCHDRIINVLASIDKVRLITPRIRRQYFKSLVTLECVLYTPQFTFLIRVAGKGRW